MLDLTLLCDCLITFGSGKVVKIQSRNFFWIAWIAHLVIPTEMAFAVCWILIEAIFYLYNHFSFFVHGNHKTSSVFPINVMDSIPNSPVQQCAGCKTSPKNCFWCKKPSNLLKIWITYNVIVCSFQNAHHKTSCKENESTNCEGLYKISFMQQCTGCVPKTFQFIASSNNP